MCQYIIEIFLMENESLMHQTEILHYILKFIRFWIIILILIEFLTVSKWVHSLFIKNILKEIIGNNLSEMPPKIILIINVISFKIHFRFRITGQEQSAIVKIPLLPYFSLKKLFLFLSWFKKIPAIM